MDGGQKTPINLEAGLNINTSDMLTPLASQTFQHNWQKYQGKFLPNSLRFEKNGWAAGWNVFNFKYDITRVKVGNYWAGYNQINDNPTYSLSIFEFENSQTPLDNIQFNINNKIISKSSGEASLDGNIINGSFNNRNYQLIWNPLTKQLSINNPNIDLSFFKKQSNLHNVTLRDLLSSKSINCDIYEGTKLTSPQFVADMYYKSFEEGKHYWGNNEFIFDGNTINGSIVPSVAGNTLTFDFDKLVNETLSVNYSFDEYYLGFDNCSIEPQSLDDKLVSLEADKSKQFNFYDGYVLPTKLEAKDTVGINAVMKVPVWFSVAFKQNTTSSNVKKPDNVKYSNVRIKTGSKVNKVLATSVFDNVTKVTESSSEGWFNLNLNYRYNKIELANTIKKSNSWNTQRYFINDIVWCFSTKQFANFSTSSGRTKISKYLGDVYTLKNCVYNGKDIFEENKWADWSDTDNAVYTESDISSARSLKLKDADDEFEVYSDVDFVEDNMPTDAELCEDHVCEVTGSHTEYDSSDEAKEYDDLYINGKYVGETYEEVEVILDDSENFWPFKYVPKFNYKKDEDTTVEGVYYVKDDLIITDLDEFKELVRGTYSDTIDKQNEVIRYNNNYNITRVITTYAPVFDFNRLEGADKLIFNEKWNKWYPGVASPQDLDAEESSDDTYLDYMDIDIQSGQTPTIQYTKPGMVIIDTGMEDWALDCLNVNDITLWEDSSSDLTARIYQNSQDCTSMYGCDQSVKPGTLKVDEWSSQSWYDQDVDYCELPGFFNQSVSGSICSYANDVTNRVCTATAESGEISLCAKPTSSKAWADEIGLSFKDGEGKAIGHKWEYVYHPATEDKPAYTKWEEVEYNYIVKDSITTLDGYYLHSSPIDGVVLAQPFESNLGINITYNDVARLVDLSSKTDELFTFSKMSDAYITNPDAIWVDRESLPLSFNWFGLEKDAIIPDAAGTGYVNLKFICNGSNELYYSKREIDSNGTEVVHDYFYPTIVGADGNMYGSSSDICMAKIAWVPVKMSLPVAVNVSCDVVNNNINHVFYKNFIQGLQNITTDIGTVDDIDPVTRTIDIVIHWNGVDLPIKFQVDTTASVLLPMSFTQDYADISLVGTSIGATFDIPLSIVYHYYNVEGNFAKVSPDTYNLINYSDNRYTVRIDEYEFIYDSNKRRVNKDVTDLVVKQNDNYYNITFSDEVKQNLILLLTDVTNNILTFIYDGETYSVDITQFLDKSDSVFVLSTDIRKPDKTETIGRIVSSKEYQLVKQQWNTTVEVENFWWIDDNHILELNQYNWVLKRKTNELDDWMGDKWSDIYKIPKPDIITSDVLRYQVTNTYNTSQHALLLVYKYVDTYTVSCDIHDTRNKLRKLSTVYFTIRHRQIGQQLNDITHDWSTAYFNTYSVITAMQLLSHATWTNTITNGKLFIGCHLSNNFEQWTAIFNLNSMSVSNVIQGYGFVGLKGDLTGGMIPADYFSVDKGFTDTVFDVSVLNKYNEVTDNIDLFYKLTNPLDINKIDAKIVGTPERQWYINKQLFGIVSHIENVDGNLTPKIIPMTNNFDASYKSPSYITSLFGDLLIEVFAMSALFHFPPGVNEIWQTIMGILTYPCVYMFNPRYASLVYLQQTLGQYAYVHYNSSESYEKPELKDTSSDNGMNENVVSKDKAPILSDDYTFDKQICEQQGMIKADSFNFSSILFSALASSISDKTTEVSVNTEQQQNAVSDTGKKYGIFSLENVQELNVTALKTDAKDIGLNSKVVGVKSLDMFYSTSDKQQIYAGPGFVEHKFVANCVAQSSTDCQTEGATDQISFTIKALTMFQMELTRKLEEATADLLEKIAEAVKETMVCGNNFGGAIAAGLMASAGAIRLALKAQEIAAKHIEAIIDILAARGVTCQRVANVSRHALSVEGKHKYGSKNEEFMWPCWGIPGSGLEYTDEEAVAAIKTSFWELSLCARKYWTSPLHNDLLLVSTDPASAHVNMSSFKASLTRNAYTIDYDAAGQVPFYTACVLGKTTKRTLPEDMACIQGVTSILPEQAFKNENIGVSDPAFSPSLAQDYVIDKRWELSQCCTYGMQQWVTVKDTKVIDCPPSNMRVTSNFCGIACPYTAVEVKRGLSKEYMRPWAITPNTLAFNCTGYNSVLDNKLYHAFDGLSYRIVEWNGNPGLNKQVQTFLYSFQVNDRFKRSNKFPANELIGYFSSDPVQAIHSLDKCHTIVTIASKEKGLEAGTIGEDKDLIRWAIPVFTEHVSTLPAAVKTMAAMTLGVVEGVTSLCVDLANNQSAYKAPLSVDFTIGKNVYRATEEYICSVQTQNGIDIVTDLIPSLGLKYIGATPTEAYFYSKSTRCYYTFTGSSLTKMDMMERFRDVQKGYWDFVNQEVVMPCLMTFKRLNTEVEDKDTETDNIIIPVLSKNQVSGELPPPITTIFNDRSWYKCVSLPCGFAYQGPNRVIINRAIFCEYMERSIKNNYSKWKKMDKEKYVTHREYPEKYDNVMKDVQGVDGWTHNPFVLVTSALGQSEDTDCIFEWNITFCWPIEMDLLYGTDNYAAVNIVAETMTPGGKVVTRPTHVYLTKELFTRSGNYGYYSFRYQSKNGMGNRERLHIWSDQYIAISSIDCEYKIETSRRNEQLTQQIDIAKLKEL